MLLTTDCISNSKLFFTLIKNLHPNSKDLKLPSICTKKTNIKVLFNSFSSVELQISNSVFAEVCKPHPISHSMHVTHLSLTLSLSCPPSRGLARNSKDKIAFLT